MRCTQTRKKEEKNRQHHHKDVLKSWHYTIIDDRDIYNKW